VIRASPRPTSTTRRSPRHANFPRMRPLALFLAFSTLSALSCTRDSDGSEAQTAFSGTQALAYVKQQVAFGPRVPGTEGHRRMSDWLIAQMRERADTVIVQEWRHVLASGDTVTLRNVFARFRPAAAERVLYLAHWDTRPIAESDPVPANRARPIPGANDGASGVALLIALADALRKSPPAVGVDLLFVDGEDYGSFDTQTDVLLGSTYFADHLPVPGYRPMYGVLFDMIGDADLRIPQEGNSVSKAPEVVARVWAQAKELGYERYFPAEAGIPITDDHIPLLNKGLRVIDVIDLDYPHHHTLADDVSKVSARSLQIVGDVALALLR